MAEDNAAVIRAIYEAFSNDDFDADLARVADDAEVVFIPTGQVFQGKEGFLQFMQGFKTAFPDVRIEVTSQIAQGDGVATEFIARGTHTGPLETPTGTIPATGRSVTFTVCEITRFRDGKLTSLHNYQDLVSLLGQLGLMPAPEGSTA